MAEGVGFEPTVGFPTLDFESSALNRTQPPFQSLDIVDRILGCAILGSAVCLQRRSRTRAFNLAGSAPLYDRLPLSYTRPNGAAGFTHCPVRSRQARSRIKSERLTPSARGPRQTEPSGCDRCSHLGSGRIDMRAGVQSRYSGWLLWDRRALHRGSGEGGGRSR
jgi:hypothetical protein